MCRRPKIWMNELELFRFVDRGCAILFGRGRTMYKITLTFRLVFANRVAVHLRNLSSDAPPGLQFEIMIAGGAFPAPQYSVAFGWGENTPD